MAIFRYALAVVVCWPLLAWPLPTFQEVRGSHQSSETMVLSREGEVLQRLRTDLTVRRGQWIPLQDVSPALLLALLVSEDKRFYAHSGVDWKAVSSAAWANVWNQKTRGASTITMQLVGLLEEGLRARNQGRSAGQKLGQAWAATQLELYWRKDQILEAYLNLLPFRGELVGIDALSRTLFGKAVHGLDAMEASMAAALVRGPNATPEVVAQRACKVWQELVEQKLLVSKVDCAALQWLAPQLLQTKRWPASEGIAPHWAQRVKVQHQTPLTLGNVRSTVSAPVQRLALESVQRHLRELQGRNVEDAAAVVLDNRSGEVLAWVGSSGSLSQAGEVDSVLALRQPGSTLKPFLYAQAIDEQRLTAASLLDDSAAQIFTGAGLYIPQNYDRRFKGWVSVRTALAASLNVPAVRTLQMVTPDAFFQQLKLLGLPLRESGGYYGYSLALGSAEVPLLHLTNAYRTLANAGRYTPVAPYGMQQNWQPEPKQVLSPQAAFVVGNILSDAQARSGTFGLNSVLATRFWTAVKTGTSKDMRDNWAVGWSQHYTVGVWVGNASGLAMHNVSGSSGAAPIWADIMAGLHAGRPSRAPAAPPGVVQQYVEFAVSDEEALQEAGRQEWFVAGTEQALFVRPAAITHSARARIVRPTDGTILALDPDIPPSQQRLQLQASSGKVGWWLNEKLLGKGEAMQWLPLPGKHTLQLRDVNGQVLDSIRLEVRGASMK